MLRGPSHWLGPRSLWVGCMPCAASTGGLPALLTRPARRTGDVFGHMPADGPLWQPFRDVFGHVSEDVPDLSVIRRPRFGSGPRRLALCTGCLTRDEGQCLHRHSSSLTARGSRAGGLRGEAQAPALPGFRLIRETGAIKAHGLALRNGCDTPDRGGRRPIGPATCRGTTRESQTKRWRDKRSASG
jgi:hypothetical protein